MKAPKQNSNALSASDSTGFVEENGIPVDEACEDDFFIVAEIRSCSAASKAGQEMYARASAAEVSALGYRCAPGAGRSQ